MDERSEGFAEQPLLRREMQPCLRRDQQPGDTVPPVVEYFIGSSLLEVSRIQGDHSQKLGVSAGGVLDSGTPPS